MKYANLRLLKTKLYFTVEDVAEAFCVKRASAWVLCSRYVKAGIFIRLKNNFYALSERWESLSRLDSFKVANYLQVPSYVSFMSALSEYGLTTQVQRDFVESVSLKRSGRFEAGGKRFNFYKLQKKYYFGFVNNEGVFIAEKEKALIDIMYLFSFGKYKPDFSSVDFTKFDKAKMRRFLKAYPEKTKQAARRLCRI